MAYIVRFDGGKPRGQETREDLPHVITFSDGETYLAPSASHNLGDQPQVVTFTFTGASAD